MVMELRKTVISSFILLLLSVFPAAAQHHGGGHGDSPDPLAAFDAITVTAEKLEDRSQTGLTSDLTDFKIGLKAGADFPLQPAAGAADKPIPASDITRLSIDVVNTPKRVVSLVPSVTEILFRIGAGKAVVGVTYHDVYPPEAATQPIVGGFFSPSPDRVQSLNPDVVFIADLHQSMVEAWKGEDRPVFLNLPLACLHDLFGTIRKLGRLFNRETAAEALVQTIQSDLNHTTLKVTAIPDSQRKRVIRFMGRDRVMAPGDDSFQNELIRRAGGVPPTLGKAGKIVPVSLEEWRAYNPEVIYGCGDDRKAARNLLNRPGWREVDAVKNDSLFYFPCDLTCRLSTRTGHFVSCLAVRLYGDLFEHLPPVRPDGVTATRPVPLDLGYVTSAEILETNVYDYIHKTLLIHLKAPMAVSSTLDGGRRGIRHVGNSFSPPQCWGLYHRIGLEASRSRLLQAIGRDADDTSLLFTGADMDHLSVQNREYRDMMVYALITAGVRSNAQRMAKDVGGWYEPGTINMIILTNMRLTARAMNRAIITATEAKTAALDDLDIRSAYTPLTNPATGTGTDNIIVVEGAGDRIASTGGHTKMGELIAKAVYAGVREAVFKQNGVVARRNVFQRLKDRRVSPFGIVDDCACGMDKGDLVRRLEHLLLEPRYAGFIETALAVSDRHERGLISDLGGFKTACEAVSREIAGKAVVRPQAFTYAEPLPPVLEMAFGALLNGLSDQGE